MVEATLQCHGEKSQGGHVWKLTWSGTPRLLADDAVLVTLLRSSTEAAECGVVPFLRVRTRSATELVSSSGWVQGLFRVSASRCVGDGDAAASLAFETSR